MTKDYDEIVFVDPTDGLAFTRREYPAFDFPVGTRVHAAGLPLMTGTVVKPSEAIDHATGHEGEEGPAFSVPVRWDGSEEVGPGWQHVDGLEIIDGDPLP